MRPYHWLSLVLAASALSACSTITSSPAPETLSASPIPATGYDWHLNEDGDEASLTFGTEQTHEVSLDLSCLPGTGALQILLSAPKGHPHKIALESGGDTETYPARAEPSALEDGLDLTATALTSDAVFVRFKSLGWIATHSPSGRSTLVAHHGTLKDIQRFFSLCG